MTRTRSIAIYALVTGILLCAGPASADSYPARYVRIITAGAGTFHDIVARHLAQRLSERWGQGVVVENQPAAGLTIGTSIAAKAPPDGYTLLLADRTSLAVAPNLYKNLRYDPVKDLRPITLVARAPSVLVAHPSVQADNLREFIAYARRQPEPIIFASAGPGTVTHLTGELFAQLAEVKILPVQYKGGPAAAMAVLGGEAKFTSAVISVVLPQIESGKVKAFAMASAKRFSGAPNIPTGAEAGLPGFEAEQWVGMLAPAGIPDAIADKLNQDIVGILRTPEFQDMLRAQGGEAVPGTPAEFATFMAGETLRLKKLIETTGVRMD
jgi:tripartite-type tricarboxylate transporter receptor subunit TctC